MGGKNRSINLNTMKTTVRILTWVGLLSFIGLLFFALAGRH